MKKIIYLMLGIVLFCSCSSSEPMDEDAKCQNIPENLVTNQEVINVQLQLDSLNQAMFAESVQTRFNFRKFFTQIGAVVLGDAIGGMLGLVNGGAVGGAIGAGVASVATAIAVFTESVSVESRSGTNSSPFDLPPVNNDSISLSPNIIPGGKDSTAADSIGYYHNYFVMTIKEVLNPEYKDVDQLINEVARLSCENFDISEKEAAEVLLAKKDFFKDISEVGKKNFESGVDLHKAIEAYKRLYPEQSDKLTLLETFLEGILKLDVSDNEGEYLNRVLEIIETSSLDSEMKQDLRNAFIVGNTSYQLWNVEGN